MSRIEYSKTNLNFNTSSGYSVGLNLTLLIPLVMMIIFSGFYLGLILFSVMFLSVLLHELGHAAMSNIFKKGTCKRIILFALGGVAINEYKEVQHPLKDFMVYFAGPFVTFILALICFLLIAILNINVDIEFQNATFVQLFLIVGFGVNFIGSSI